MEKIIRQDELAERLGVSRQTLYVWEKRGQMPKRFKLARASRASGWLESDINQWLQERSAKANEQNIEEHAEGIK